VLILLPKQSSSFQPKGRKGIAREFLYRKFKFISQSIISFAVEARLAILAITFSGRKQQQQGAKVLLFIFTTTADVCWTRIVINFSSSIVKVG